MLTKRFLFFLFLTVLTVITGCSQSKADGDNSNLPLSLDRLQGMYSGFRDDFGGYECGGMCWDIYTFLPKGKVLIGLPADGGPETINCKKDECLDYKIKDGEMILSNGESLPIEISDDKRLIINKIKLSSVEPVSKGLTLNNNYTYIGYSGLIGINGAASSWTYKLSLKADGTFELSGVTLGSIGATSGGSSTHGSHSDDGNTGTYKIQNNTLTMKSNDGTTKNLLFFIHDSDEDDIQVGDKNYYVKKD